MANRTTPLPEINLKGTLGSTDSVDPCSAHVVALEMLHARVGVGAIDGRRPDSPANSPKTIVKLNSSSQLLRDHPAPDLVGRLFMRVCLWVELLSTLREKYQ
jgi:hypothetical protein